MAKKAKVLYFNSQNEAELMKKKVEDGFIEVKGGKYYVEPADPILLKGTFGFTPLYIIKWDTPHPAEVESLSAEQMKEIEEITEGKLEKEEMEEIMERAEEKEPTQVHQIVFTKDEKVEPKTLKSVMDLAILRNMMEARKKPLMEGGMLPLIIGLGIGAAVIYIMGAMGFLHF